MEIPDQTANVRSRSVIDYFQSHHEAYSGMVRGFNYN